MHVSFLLKVLWNPPLHRLLLDFWNCHQMHLRRFFSLGYTGLGLAFLKMVPCVIALVPFGWMSLFRKSYFVCNGPANNKLPQQFLIVRTSKAFPGLMFGPLVKSLFRCPLNFKPCIALISQEVLSQLTSPPTGLILGLLVVSGVGSKIHCFIGFGAVLKQLPFELSMHLQCLLLLPPGLQLWLFVGGHSTHQLGLVGFPTLMACLGPYLNLFVPFRSCLGSTFSQMDHVCGKLSQPLDLHHGVPSLRCLSHLVGVLESMACLERHTSLALFKMPTVLSSMHLDLFFIGPLLRVAPFVCGLIAWVWSTVFVCCSGVRDVSDPTLSIRIFGLGWCNQRMS